MKTSIVVCIDMARTANGLKVSRRRYYNELEKAGVEAYIPERYGVYWMHHGCKEQVEK